MRTDAVRFATNSSHARSLLCATKASATDQSTLPPRPDGTTRLPSRVLRGGGSAQPITGCSSEKAARDSLRPRVVKANPSSSGRGYLIADGARRRPRAGSRRHPANGRQSCDRASQLPGVLPLAISTQTDGLWVALERPFCVSGCSPTVLTPNVDDGHCQQLS
jgi:hypothetical protein